jgi:putative ABC transport system substrate-binding protein
MNIGVRHEATGNSKKLKVICFALCVMLFVLCGSANAQQPGKIFRIGYLDPSTVSGSAVLWEAFRQELSKLGWIDGKNIVIEYRSAEGKLDRRPELAAELVRLKVDIIVVSGGLGTIQAVKNATKTIPIVMAGAGIDPVVSGLIDSLARPGGNVTGITNLSREMGGKRLELLKDAVPKLARVAVLYESDNPGSLRELKEVLPVAARELRLTVQPREARDADGFEKIFAALKKECPDGLYDIGAGRVMRPNQKRTVGFALKSRLPSVYSNREAVDAGALMSYGTDRTDSYRRVAYYVDRILKGAKPADLPVEQPTKFELAINLKTAKQIGLTIPPEVLARATKIIRSA